jgi:16S rRNA (cytosine967-C5)-methyltransferase
MNAANPRWIALQVILQVVEHGRSLDDIFQSDWFQSLSLSRRDQGLAREIAFGLCRWYFSLSHLLRQRLQKPLRARDRDIETVLLIGLYQLLVMRTDSHAAVNETVKLALAQKKKWAKGLVNAVLRGVIRDKIELDENAGAEAYPDWMRTRIEADWGEQAESILLAGTERPPMTLRVDTRQCEIESVIAKLAADGILATRHALVDTAILLETPCDVSQLPGFEQGLLSVQDAAAQLAAPSLSCAPGARVLDACAAPGGKTLHLLQSYADIEVDALDSSESRLLRLRENLQRGGQSARILVGDAASPEDWFDGRGYDAVLADLPCSASGVLRRHPDIKLLRRESDIMPLLTQQSRMLQALWTVLKPGGKMLFSTCSIFKEENETQVARFLQQQTDAIEVSLEGVEWGEPRSHGRQILSGRDNMDGFYYALLTRSANE